MFCIHHHHHHTAWRKEKTQALEPDRTNRKGSVPLFLSCLMLAPFCACLLNCEMTLLYRVPTRMTGDKICGALSTGLAHGEP